MAFIASRYVPVASRRLARPQATWHMPWNEGSQEEHPMLVMGYAVGWQFALLAVLLLVLAWANDHTHAH